MAVPSIKQFSEILAELITEGKERMPKVKNWVSGGVFHSIFAVFAKGLAALYAAVSQAIDLTFVASSEGVYLRRIADQWGKPAADAVAARGRVIFFREETTGEKTIKAGSWVATDTGEDGTRRRFFTLAEATLEDGEAEVEVAVEAEDGGSDWNVGGGTITVIDSSLPGVDGVRNDQEDGWLDREGADAEDDDGLKERLPLRWAEVSLGKVGEAYKSAALAIAGVVTVTVDSLAPRGDGTVDIIITSTAEDGLPSVDLLAECQAAVDLLKPDEADVLVRGPTPYSIDYHVRLTQSLAGGDAATIQAAAEAAIDALHLPGTGTYRFLVGEPVTLARIFATLIAVPYVANVVILEPASDIDVGRSGMAVKGAVTVEVL